MIQQILSMLGDGEGNTSTTRVVLFLFTLYILTAHILILVKTGVLQPFSGDELSLLGILFGAKLVQNSQENAPAKPETK